MPALRIDKRRKANLTKEKNGEKQVDMIRVECQWKVKHAKDNGDFYIMSKVLEP